MSILDDETHRHLGATTAFRSKIEQLRQLSADVDARNVATGALHVPTPPDPEAEPPSPVVPPVLST